MGARRGVAFGGALLFVSLFLTWSHQPAAGRRSGVPPAATAWQVYTWADGLMAGLAVALVAVALVAVGSARAARRARLTTGAAVLVALAFVAHAIAVAPTDGVADPARATPGLGEALAVAGLAIALLSLTLGEKWLLYDHNSPSVPRGHPS